jgi:hypothetical protein
MLFGLAAVQRGPTKDRPMLYDPARHEPLLDTDWDEDRVRACIKHIVVDAEARFTAQAWWPPHPLDVEPGEDAQQPCTPLYYGACGVAWTLHYLQDVGAVRLQRSYREAALMGDLLARNTAWLGDEAATQAASFMMGELPLRLVEFGVQPLPQTEDRLHALIAGNMTHPARELMWGAPGTMLAALHLHERFGADDPRWAALFRRTRSGCGHSACGPTRTAATTGRRTCTADAAATSMRCTASPARPSWRCAVLTCCRRRSGPPGRT